MSYWATIIGTYVTDVRIFPGGPIILNSALNGTADGGMVPCENSGLNGGLDTELFIPGIHRQ